MNQFRMELFDRETPFVEELEESSDEVEESSDDSGGESESDNEGGEEEQCEDEEEQCEDEEEQCEDEDEDKCTRNLKSHIDSLRELKNGMNLEIFTTDEVDMVSARLETLEQEFERQETLRPIRTRITRRTQYLNKFERVLRAEPELTEFFIRVHKELESHIQA